MEKEKRKWVRDNKYIHVCAYILRLLSTCLNETKKGGERSKSYNNIGIANMQKMYRRQDRDPGWLGHNG